MVLTAPLLLATCVGCSTSSTPIAPLPAIVPQPKTTSWLDEPAHQLAAIKVAQAVTPDAPLAMEWSARSRESSPGQVLQIGSQGAVVARLQVRLARLGYAVDDVDGIFGPKTQAMVMRFQQAYGLVPDGVVKANIWEKLNRDITASGRVKSEVPGQSIAQGGPAASPSPTATATAPSSVTATSATATSAHYDSPSAPKTKWITVLVVLQGIGWLIILQGLNKELVVLTGRSLIPGTSKQWLFSFRH